MPSFTTDDGVEIAYDEVAPDGFTRSVLLVHGFSSNRYEGWRRTGWYSAVERRGERCVALDLRGHGESGKPHDPAAYGRARMAADVADLIERLDLRGCALFGYSMGAGVALQAALNGAPIGDLILGGVGERLIGGGDAEDEARAAALPSAMLAADPDSIEDPLARSFRYFADEQGEDLAALAAVLAKRAPPFAPHDLAALRAPLLVVAGARDELAGDPESLALAAPGGRAVTVPGCDHFSAIPHALTKAAVFDFLDGMLDFD